jgi:hypothetical protein
VGCVGCRVVHVQVVFQMLLLLPLFVFVLGYGRVVDFDFFRSSQLQSGTGAGEYIHTLLEIGYSSTVGSLGTFNVPCRCKPVGSPLNTQWRTGGQQPGTS